MNKIKGEGMSHRKKVFLIVFFSILILGSIMILPKKTITCERVVQRTVREPYEATETYYEREPYTICAGHSFWTGKCNKWKTEYERVKKYRTITKYRDVKKDVRESYPLRVNWIVGRCLP